MANNPNLIENVKTQFWFVLFSILVFFFVNFETFYQSIVVVVGDDDKKNHNQQKRMIEQWNVKKPRNFNHFLVVLCLFYSSNSFCHWILSKFYNASCDMLLLMKLMENQFPVHSFIWLCKQCICRLLFFFIWLNFKKKNENTNI